MVGALTPGSSGLGLSLGQGHCVVFLGRTLHSYSACLHPGVQMGTNQLLGNLTNCRGVACNGLASHTRGVEILLAASCY